MRVALFAGILAIAFSIGAQEIPPNTAPATSTEGGGIVRELQRQQKAERAKQASQNEPQIAPCNQASPCYVIEEPKAKSKEQKAKEDSLDALYRRDMKATIGGVLGAFIGLAVLIWQTILTRKAANAAKASAEALISAERGWVMVDLVPVPAGISLVLGHTSKGHNEPDRQYISARVRCVCNNQGKTPAKILEKRAAAIIVKADQPLPEQPNFDIEIQDPVPHYVQGNDAAKRDWTLFADGKEETGAMVVVYGTVRYRHLFSNQDVHSSFGYRIVNNELERLTDYPKYNENT
jgi:hypothetical protein